MKSKPRDLDREQEQERLARDIFVSLMANPACVEPMKHYAHGGTYRVLGFIGDIARRSFQMAGEFLHERDGVRANYEARETL